MTGRYNTPLALAREPWTAAFFTLCAPLLFPVVLGAVIGASGQVEPGAGWLVICVAAALQFALVSVWSRWLGAGPFAGSMRTGMGWVLAALIAGPVILNAPEQLIEAVIGGQGDWIYRDGEQPESLRRSNWSLSFVFYVILLAPIVEEVTYRGVAMGTMLARGFNPVLAAIIASAVFTLMHTQYSPVAMLAVFVSGLGLAALRLMSGTVIVPIIAHMAANIAVLMPPG